MKRELWLFRHAKSDWSTPAADRERPLSKRGRKNGIRMGQWMSENRLLPDRIISSPAERAFQTCEFLQQGFQGDLNVPNWDERLYMADLDTLLTVIREQDHTLEKLMIVAHNPGLDDLLQYLCAGELPRSSKGKLMTTSTLARVEIKGNWGDIDASSNHLIQIARPKEILD